VFPVRYKLNFYVVFTRNLVFKGLSTDSVCIQFAGYDLKILHHSYVYSSILINSILFIILGMFIMQLRHTKFHIPSSVGPLVITVRLKCKQTYLLGYHAAVLLITKGITLAIVPYISKTCY
jgi:hypothetical protein